MVYLQSLKCKGLYSFSDHIELEFPTRTVIVGPNNSGKSNILRILKTFVDSFYHRTRLDSSQIFVNEYNPLLEVSISLSESETKKIVDFFSFFPDDRNESSNFYELDNYDVLVELFDYVIISLNWRREVESDNSEPYVKMDFPKIGLKFFGRLYSEFRISNSFPELGNERKFENDVKLIDVLKKITNKESATQIVDDLFKVGELEEIGTPRIRININKDFSDKGRITLTKLYSYLKLSISSSREVYFAELLGTILQKGFQISSGSKGISSISILDVAEKLKTPDTDMIATANDEQVHFNTVLKNQASSKALEFNELLESDGSNITSFLFSLKNSSKQEDRTKFKKIQEGFSDLFTHEKLSFDVILQYTIPGRQSVWSGAEGTKPSIPIIMIEDEYLQRQFVADQVGTGLLEAIYLLTLSYGIENSVILLDEPAVNLHPTLMKSISKSLQNPDLTNQFIIITHSPELASYEIFDNKASLIYIRKKGNSSIVKILKDNVKEWFDRDRHKLKHQIDSHIFFGNSVILTEGDSDKNFLDGIASSLEINDPEVSVTKNDVIITHVGGKNNFKKYIDLMKTFDIPYLALGDLDAKNLFDKSGIINKDTVKFVDSAIIIECGKLEDLMKEIDLDIYTKALNDNGNSKPAVAYVFAEEISNKSPEKLNSIKLLLLKAIDKAN